MSVRARAFFAVAAGAALLAGAGASGGAPTRAPAGTGGVLFTDEGSGTVESGLWLVTPAGRVTRLLDRRWHPWARSASGVIAATKADASNGPLWLVSRQGATRVPGSAGASCVSWSSDGGLLTYVTGKAFVYAQLPRGQGAWGRSGAVWVVRASAPSHPRRIAGGVSASSSCPAWSSSGQTLAYLIRTDPAGPWALTLFAGGRSTTVATLRTTLPAIDHQSFAWAPSKAQLVFVDGTSLYRYDGSGTSVLGQPGSLDPVQSLSVSRGSDVSDPHVGFSPNGRLIAAGISDATGVFHADGSLLRTFPGGFSGWAGNAGVLTVGTDLFPGGGPSIPTLRLNPLDGGPGALMAKFFKLDVATDPAGHWFAYFTPTYPWESIVFRLPKGTREGPTGRLLTVPHLVAAVSARGRTAPPIGGSTWAR